MNLRKFENFHIVLWLIKDTCWAAEFKPGGMIMIVPTVAMAVFITIKSRHQRDELLHNLSVTCWILANTIWMTGEFFGYEMRPYALVFFSLGLLFLAIHYIPLIFKKQTPDSDPA